jgi:hypothetical protein
MNDDENTLTPPAFEFEGVRQKARQATRDLLRVELSVAREADRQQLHFIVIHQPPFAQRP